MANSKTWTVGTYMHDGISWMLIAGRGDRVTERDARSNLAFCESQVDEIGGVAELRHNGVLVAEYRSACYRPGGRHYHHASA